MDSSVTEFWQLWNKYAKVIIVITLVTAVPTFFVEKAVAMGAVLGGIVALLNFRLLALSIQQAVDLPPDKARTFTFSRYMLRFLINMALFTVLLLRKDLGPASLLGAVPPFFAVKITLFLEAMIKHFGMYLRKKNDERR